MIERKCKIIIVDDNSFKRQVYAEKFRSEGFEVLEAENGQIGLEKIKSEKPNLIITGIDMPMINGFNLIGELKKFPPTAELPIIVSSHLNRPGDDKKALDLGADEFIYFGFVPLNEVVEKAKILLAKHGHAA